MKKYKGNMLVRTMAFILCVVFFVMTLISSMLLVVDMNDAGRRMTLEEIFAGTDYMESEELQEQFSKTADVLRTLIYNYKSEAYIESGETLSLNEGALYEELWNLYYDGIIYAGGKDYKAKYVAGDDESFELSEQTRIQFAELNKEAVDAIKNILIKEDLRHFRNLKESLDEQKGLSYYVTDGKYKISSKNARIEDFKEYPAYMIYRDGELEKVPASEGRASHWISTIDNDIENSLFSLYNDDLQMYIGFDKAYINEKQAAYEDTDNLMMMFIVMMTGITGCLVMFIYLMVTTGRMKSVDEESGETEIIYGIYGLDKIWTEVQLAMVTICAVMGTMMAAYSLDGWLHSDVWSVEVTVMAGIFAVTAALGLWFVLSIIRLFKNRLFIKNSLIYKLWNLVIHRWCGSLLDSIKNVYHGSSLMKKTVVLALAGCLLSATVFLAPVVFLAIIALAPKVIEKFEAVEKGVEEVKNGNLAYKIEIDGKGEFKRLADSINEISEASNKAIQNELKNQRMKTELISNVSHDLKTPLTSMVTYIDLLKKEGLDSENAPEYLKVLDEKTERLRRLTEDLFEAAKASSGAMPVELGKVDLLSLINQGMGEMEKRIDEAGLDFIVNSESEKAYVSADGQLLWRVVENLMGNVLKYALEGSRVYVDIKEIKG
ncbi:MAG: histidine kinase dimerization/phospho-acceptor domain-containing protein, partial [Anaerovoracaceae bacterium]